MSFLDFPLARKMGQGQPLRKGFDTFSAKTMEIRRNLLYSKTNEHNTPLNIISSYQAPYGTFTNLSFVTVLGRANSSAILLLLLAGPSLNPLFVTGIFVEKLLRTGLHHHVTVREERKQPKHETPCSSTITRNLVDSPSFDAR